jgi:hypothetical protein
MKAERLRGVVHLAEKVGHVFVATADPGGMPHVTTAGKLELAPEGRVIVTEWFCPGTVANLHANKYISVVVWAKDSDSGYQLLGRLDKIKDLGILDGYAPELEEEPPLPQVEKQLLIKVEKIIEFKPGPHSDIEDWSEHYEKSDEQQQSTK